MARSPTSQRTIDRLAAALDNKVQHSADTHDVTGDVLAAQIAEGAPRAWDAPRNPRVTAPNVRVQTNAQGRGVKSLVAEKLQTDDARVDRVRGADPDEVSARAVSRASRETQSASVHAKKLPGGFAQSQSYSSVKVAAAAATPPTDKDVIAKLRKLTANTDALAKYRGLILSEPLILDIPLDQLPDVPFPRSDSPQVVIELQTIRDTMDMQPLLDDVMDLADDEPLELFRRACNDIGIPIDTELLPLIVNDLRRYAMALKYVYKRPRPFEVAPYYGMTVIPTEVDPYEGSPSYPSIHATIGYGVANYYAHMYPQHADHFRDVAETIALQRIQSGHHFPSDNEYARLIANVLLRDEARAPTESTQPAPSAKAPPTAEDTPPRPTEKVAQYPRGVKFLRRT